MSTNNPSVDDSGDSILAMDQNETRCRILGIDENGYEHVHDKERNRIVVLDRTGIDVQYDLEDLENDVDDWMKYVQERRGWAKEQWLGYVWKDVLSDSINTRRTADHHPL